MPALTPTQIELPTGVSLTYVEQGDPEGVPVILLHGVTDSWRSFESVLPHLPDSIRAFALTQRGHGDAGRPATGYRTADFARDLAAFLEVMHLNAAVIAGHSIGTANAMRFAIDHPDRVLGLVLAAAFATYRNNSGLVEFWRTDVSQLCDPIEPAFAREFQEGTLGRPIPPTFLDMVVHESLKVPARVWRAAFEGLFEDDFASEMHAIRAPTLLAWGNRDLFSSRADQDAILKAIDGSRLAVYPEVGHALHWEEPKRFADDLANFVAHLHT